MFGSFGGSAGGGVGKKASASSESLALAQTNGTPTPTPEDPRPADDMHFEGVNRSSVSLSSVPETLSQRPSTSSASSSISQSVLPASVAEVVEVAEQVPGAVVGGVREVVGGVGKVASGVADFAASGVVGAVTDKELANGMGEGGPIGERSVSSLGSEEDVPPPPVPSDAPAPTPPSTTTPTPTVLTPADFDAIVTAAMSVLEAAYGLSSQWSMKRGLFRVLETVLRTSYNTAIKSSISSLISSASDPDVIAGQIDGFRDGFWPGKGNGRDEWWSTAEGYVWKERTGEEKRLTKEEARRLFVGSWDSLKLALGASATSAAAGQLFDVLQGEGATILAQTVVLDLVRILILL